MVQYIVQEDNSQFRKMPNFLEPEQGIEKYYIIGYSICVYQQCAAKIVDDSLHICMST